MARGRAGPRGTKAWDGFTFNETALALTQVVLGFTAAGEPVTFLRNRGNILVKGTPDAATDDDIVGFGIITVSDNARAVGGSSVPGPIADPDAPWIWHQYVPLQAGSAGLLGDDIGSIVRVDIDSKAMRRMTPNENLILVGELSTGLFSTVTVNGGLRSLIMHS